MSSTRGANDRWNTLPLILQMTRADTTGMATQYTEAVPKWFLRETQMIDGTPSPISADYTDLYTGATHSGTEAVPK
jgi:hypothetical protein